MNITDNRTKIILDALFDRFDVFTAEKYGEPGYTNPEQQILFANWNNISSTIQDYLDEAGFELEWSGEWIVADNGKAYRTNPTSYYWQPSYILTDNGDILTRDDDAAEIINECKIWDQGQQPRAVPNWITPAQIEAEGYTLFNPEPYENGWHPGQTDEPQEIASVIFDAHGPCDVVFRLTENSQFYQRFDAYYRQD